jgi:RalA-binding protein 1
MSPPVSRDGITSHTRPTPGAPPSLNSDTSTSSHQYYPPPSPAPAGPVLSNTLIPRDYLASLSKSRLNAGTGAGVGREGASSNSPGAGVVADSTVPSPSATSSSGISSQATARALQDNSSDDSDDEDELIIQQVENVSPLTDRINVVKTRPNASAAASTRPPTLTQPPTSPPPPPGPRKASVPASAISDAVMPRTSSIDSAISTVSNSSYGPKAAAEQKEPSVTDIRNLIATAGSAENLVQHLLRDKAHAASQNAQLWKLVDKQRALLLGLNKDLERVSKDRDRYRKKAKELQAFTESIGAHSTQNHTPPTSAGAGEESRGLPLSQPPPAGGSGQPQGHKSDWQDDSQSQPTQGQIPAAVRSPVEAGMMPSPLHPQHSLPANGIVPTASPEMSYSPNPNPSIDAALQQQPPKLSALTTQLAPPPAFSVIEATPIAESPARSLPAQRKAPPKPLDLTQTKEEVKQTEIGSPKDTEDGEHHQRGRRKTRDEDDRDRELAVQQEQEARSRSKKEKRSKVDQARADGAPMSPTQASVLDQQTSPRPAGGTAHLLASPPAADSLHPTGLGTDKKMLSPPLRSPGLPASPRPADRPLASPLPGFVSQSQTIPKLPMSPRNGGFPLSPRAPKQPLPSPTNIHSQEVLDQKLSEATLKHQADSSQTNDRLQVQPPNMGSGEAPPVYRGLVSPTWPDLLLPPNALPSIQVKVASSRLRPSRFSVLGFKPQEDTSVFTLSIFSRSSPGELWRLEKIPAALGHLDQQLRPRCPQVPRLPDRKLFTGHAPATLDTRRNAIDAYFEELLDTHVDEQSAFLICKFLSTDVLEPPANQRPQTARTNSGQPQVDSSGKIKKTGFLTKKGKNFGGWKSRYFVLDSPELRYFEAPGGAHLGTIKLHNAKIGRQTTQDVTAEDGEPDSQFRHAFLILEPKRKDNGSYLRHVLCAENDNERDDWVRALLHFVEETAPNDNRPTTSGGASDSADLGNPRALLRGTDFGDGHSDHPGKSSSPILGQRPSGGSSPTTPSPQSPGLNPTYDGQWPKAGSASSGVSNPAQRAAPRQQQPFPQASKEQKIRNLFQFRKSSHEQLSTSQSSEDRARQHGNAARGYVRPVFGLALAEAVEICPPQDVNVMLPAVVYRCIEYLREKNAKNEEGLFRLSGSNVVIRSLKERFNTEGDVDLVGEDDYYDVHAVASLFKTYLRELPATILTRDLHIEFLKVLEFDDKQHKVIAFNALVHQLPPVNFSLLRALSEYLLEVVQNSDKNKMSVKNVGIVFSPTLNIPAPVFSLFLTEFDSIFNQNLRQGRQENIGMMATLMAPPDMSEMRTPRTQTFSHLPASPNPANHEHSHGPPPQQHLEHSYHHGASDHAPVATSSYESRNYVSIPSQAPPPQPMYPAPQPNQPLHQHQSLHPNQGPNQRQQYRMFAPQDAANDKAKRRESAMLLF